MTPPPAESPPDAGTEIDKHSPLICPVCEQALSWDDRICVCARGHSFDLAREGYVNLLLSHHRRSRHPGDSADMIRARRRFFDSGAFDRVAGLVRDEVQRLLARRETGGRVHIVDAGCGEGYFLGALQQGPTCSSYGVDVSKEAVRLAARQHKGPHWIVANVMRRIPFAGDSIDLVLSVLAPRNVGEFARILKTAGHLVLIVPGPNHLAELTARLMADAQDFQSKADEAVALCAPYFGALHKRLLTFEVMLSRELLSDLVQMTPLFWRSSRKAKARIDNLDKLRVTISFVLLTFAPIS